MDEVYIHPCSFFISKTKEILVQTDNVARNACHLVEEKRSFVERFIYCYALVHLYVNIPCILQIPQQTYQAIEPN